MKIFHDCEDINDMQWKLINHAKRYGLHLSEMWIEDHWLCYVMREKVDEEEHRKEKLRFFEEKYWRKLEHTWTTMNATSKRKDHKWKINLCLHIDPWKGKSREIKRRILDTEWYRPNR